MRKGSVDKNVSKNPMKKISEYILFLMC